jgi:hypothetical protein
VGRAPLRLRLVQAGAVLAAAGAAHAWRNARLLAVCDPAPAPCTEAVVVCVPARDEQATIARLVGDLRAQVGVAELVVHILDDASTDGTAHAATVAAGADRRVTVHRSHSRPPPGWLGKSAACQALADIAWGARVPPQVLVFVDADVRLAPHALAAGVQLLRERRLALLSPWPAQVARTPAERLLQPLQQWSWLVTLPLGVAERSGRASLAAANGQLLVLDAAAYRGVGGHTAVAGEVLEDIALARVLRRAGHRTAPADGSTIASCRMYPSAAALRAGYGKSLWAAFGSPAGSVAVALALAIVYVLPAVGALAGSGRTRAWGAAGWAAGVASRVISARAAGTRVWPDAAAHPVSILALLTLIGDSHRAHRRGTISWKGRQLP